MRSADFLREGWWEPERRWTQQGSVTCWERNLSLIREIMHAYVMGEHGDSEFVPWSQAMMATKPIFDLCSETEGCHFQELLEIEEEVRMAAYKIIEAKRATYYGIGMAMARITKAIFGNEYSVLTVSALLQGEYGEKGVFIGIPCVVNRMGVSRIIELSLSAEEKQRLHLSVRHSIRPIRIWRKENPREKL